MFKEFLERHKVELLSTTSAAERGFGSYLKDKCKKIKAECRQRVENSDNAELVPLVLRTYNFKTKHAAHSMTPAVESKKKNQEQVRGAYEIKSKGRPSSSSLD